MTNRVGVIFTESRSESITHSKFGSTNFREFGRVRVGGMESFELRGGLEIYFEGADNVNGEDRVNANMNRALGTTDHIGL